HIRGGGKCEIAWTYRRPLDAVMHAQHVERVPFSAPLRLPEQVAEAHAHAVALIGKTGQSDGSATNSSDERAWTIEDMDAVMRRKACVRQVGALVIAGNDEHGHTPLRDALEWLVCLVRQRLWDRRAIEDVSGMDDEINLTGERRLERG